MSDNTSTPLPTDAALQSFDPYRDVPSPVEIVGHPTFGASLEDGIPMEALPPAMRDRITAALSAVTPGNRDLFQARYIEDELIQNSIDLRIMGGVGADATPTQRATFEIANRLRLLKNERETVKAELAEVIRHDTREDPASGKVEAVPVYRITGERRRGWENRLAELDREERVIHEIEKPRQLAEANEATRKQILDSRNQLAELQEANVLADKIVRDERVQKLAEAKARMRRDHIG